MATQASAITFLSTPGQAYQSGLGFVQNYFGMPFALIIICMVFIPIYKRLKVYTAYEYLGKRFDLKTRLLGASLFLLARGLAAGITIYAPAIIVSKILGWNLDLTIVLVGVIVIIYTVSGGTKAVSITQRYQMGVILVGMVIAFVLIVLKLPEEISFGQAIEVAGKMGKLEAVDFSFDINKRYTFWSGMFGGVFLMLSYFGTDQSQVQRYLAGTSIKESRIGLLFNAVVKIPMQFFILLVGVMVFIFYQFEKPPVFFHQAALEQVAASDRGDDLRALQLSHDSIFEEKRTASLGLAVLLKGDDEPAIEQARKELMVLDAEDLALREEVRDLMIAVDPEMETKDSDYVFITFILNYLPKGVIGLLMAVIFAAAMSSTASELNALGSTTTIDFYRKLINHDADDHHIVRVSRILTAAWGVLAVLFAFGAKLVENLIEYVNILASIFNGVILGIFLVAFFIKYIKGSAVFFAAIISQTMVIVMFRSLDIGYLWYNLIGCFGTVFFALALQTTVFRKREILAG